MDDELYRRFIGRTSEELVEALVPDSWERWPASKGIGIRYRDGKGNQVRIMAGDPTARDVEHRGPYAVVRLNGNPTRIPLKGNPVLRDNQ
jgi:hypothetical protein